MNFIQSVLDSFTWRSFLRSALTVQYLAGGLLERQGKSIIIDTDFFSDVDDAGALLLASTLPDVNILAVNVNHPSFYSGLGVSALLAHYGYPDVPIGLRRPITNESFLDTWSYDLGEFASKVAFHWSGGTLPWGCVEKAWDPVDLYRKTLSEQKDSSVTIVSLGFLENLSSLLNSTADVYSKMSGSELIAAKVAELVIMGGEYPSGHEYNFWGDGPSTAENVVNNWKGRITYSGFELGSNVFSGAPLTVEGPENDPVRAAYRWYVGYNSSRQSWDPLTVLYACQGLGDIFEWGNSEGHNHVFPNGSNSWIYKKDQVDQHFLRLKVDNAVVEKLLDHLFLRGARSVKI